MAQLDKAGPTYWDNNWTQVALPKLFDSADVSLDNYVNWEFHKYFQKLLGNKKDLKILEIGCANSIWLPYFHKYFRAKVYGLDYSAVGCEASRTLLKHYQIPAEVYQADLFHPPETLCAQFDLVVSFGVVEHFENTAACLKACAAFVKPGGHLFTLIPNMSSLMGTLQKFVDRSVYDVHVPLTREQLAEAHKKAGLSLQICDYFMFVNCSVVNSGSLVGHPLNKVLRKIFAGISKFFWLLECLGLKLPPNKISSPYIFSITS